MGQTIVLDALVIKRGIEQNRGQLVPKAGEPVYITDTKELYIGDGVTAGGNPVGALRVSGTVTDGALVLFDGTTGKRLKASTKAAFLADYVSQSALEARLKSQLAVQVDSSKVSDNALKLNGRSDYITADTRTSNYLEDDSNKVATAKATATLFKDVGAQFKIRDDAIALKMDKSSVVNAVTSTSITLPCSANSVKQAYDLAYGAQQIAVSSQTLAQTAIATGTAAGSAAQAARSAPDLPMERKRVITISANPASGTPDEGTVWIQV